MTLLPVQDEKITCEVSEFLDSRDSKGKFGDENSGIAEWSAPKQ
jgi:hypothetical protein